MCEKSMLALSFLSAHSLGNNSSTSTSSSSSAYSTGTSTSTGTMSAWIGHIGGCNALLGMGSLTVIHVYTYVSYTTYVTHLYIHTYIYRRSAMPPGPPDDIPHRVGRRREPVSRRHM